MGLVSGEDFKAAMACRSSAVSIVTARAGERVHGMTVSDFTSVSLDPPLVVVCASKDSQTLEVINDGKCFAINILAADQQDLSNVFASKKHENTRFEGLSTSSGVTGAPLIDGAHVHVDCRLVAAHDAGDHILCVGQVEQTHVCEREPLVYYRGRYRALAE